MYTLLLHFCKTKKTYEKKNEWEREKYKETERQRKQKEYAYALVCMTMYKCRLSLLEGYSTMGQCITFYLFIILHGSVAIISMS